ncbi:MAG: bifunctional alpha,alpha-trehalose-phosphate synthase (UDP-forming)/trehalose-phosphatase [Spirochaetes bacterium]|nr:bifunctional alpha,alpha-trehalose-phosphate synthase (UDP-forming)/trehalose-phosphatase [Spirochaetota bacterium]
MDKVIFVSNRLPITIEKKEGQIIFKQSIGGLATGLNSIHKEKESLWVGWCGIADDDFKNKEKLFIEEKLKNEYNSIPIFLSKEDLKYYYNGFCNKTIWPLFHYFPKYTDYDNELWEYYKKINQYFFNKISKIIGKNDHIWIHDYQLMLLPKLVKEKFPTTKIGFFLHIPFPSYEIFRLLSWREEILEGILGADLIGFHTYDYVRHFISSVRRILGIENNLNYITLENRLIEIDAFPMGIDYKKFNNSLGKTVIKNEIKKIDKKISNTKVILSVDRLDYTKGIPQRLNAFDLFLKNNQEYKEKVTLILIVAPSRTKVGKYLDLKKEVDELVSSINGEHATMGWMPVWYFFQSFTFNELTAMYGISDILLVTPLRDGMNLVAKEYIATKNDKKGVLILSETAGVASELGEAVIINPNNIDEISNAIKYALEVPESEQIKKNTVMHERLKRYNVEYWAKDFMKKLDNIHKIQEEQFVKKLTDKIKTRLIKDYNKSKKRIIFLDYNGTLVSFVDETQKEKIDKELLDILNKFSNDSKNELVILSGSNKEILEEHFKNIDLNIVADHGVWIKEKKQSWKIIETMSNDWKEVVKPVLEIHTDRTPGSFIKEKDFSLTWNYKKCEPDLASVRVSELKEALLNLTHNLNIGIFDGNKLIEIKNTNYSKARGVSLWLNKQKWDFILAIGDDWTDEDMFTILPNSAYSIKVGFDLSAANYNVKSVKEVRGLLKDIG